jgi:hypothetical protein
LGPGDLVPAACLGTSSVKPGGYGLADCTDSSVLWAASRMVR